MNKFLPVILALSLAVSCASSGNKEKATLAGVLAADYAHHPVDSEDLAKVNAAKNYFSLALDFYNQKEYDSAIEHYILACADYTFRIVYYHLGLCLMDAGDYENAKKAFEKSLNLYVDTYTRDLYTFDDNGVPQETYFAYYNIACIESLQNNLPASYDYVSKAVFYGYNYTDYMKKDPDLQNLWNHENGRYLKAIEERIANMEYNVEKDFIYNIIDNNRAVAITRYVGTRKDVRIPPVIRNLPVTMIEGWAFERQGLTTVSIPPGVTNIGKAAFAYNQLTDVIIPRGVMSVGEEVFAHNRLTRVTIPDTLKSINVGAFMSNQLKHLVIPHGVLQARDNAFMDNQIENLYLPRTLDWIDKGAFRNNPVVSVTIGSNIDFLPLYEDMDQIDNNFALFYYKKAGKAGTYIYQKGRWKIKSINTVNFVNNIYYNQPVFDEIDDIFSIGVDSDGRRLYIRGNNEEFLCIENDYYDYIEISSYSRYSGDSYEEAIEFFEIPAFINKKPVKIIGESAFYDIKIKTIKLPPQLEIIEDYAFWGSRIEKIIIPGSVRTIGKNALSGNPLTEITIGENVVLSPSEEYNDLNTFIEFYDKNNRQAGRYSKHYNDDYSEHYWEYER